MSKFTLFFMIGIFWLINVLMICVQVRSVAQPLLQLKISKIHNDGAGLANLNQNQYQWINGYQYCFNDQNTILARAITPSQEFITPNYTGSIILLNTRDNSTQLMFNLTKQDPLSISMSPDHKYIAGLTGSAPNYDIEIVNLKTGVQVFYHPNSPIESNHKIHWLNNSEGWWVLANNHKCFEMFLNSPSTVKSILTLPLDPGYECVAIAGIAKNLPVIVQDVVIQKNQSSVNKIRIIQYLANSSAKNKIYRLPDVNDSTYVHSFVYSRRHSTLFFISNMLNGEDPLCEYSLTNNHLVELGDLGKDISPKYSKIKNGKMSIVLGLKGAMLMTQAYPQALIRIPNTNSFAYMYDGYIWKVTA